MPTRTITPKSERTPEEIAAIDIPEAVIEQPEDDSVSRIIADHIKPTLTGLVITGELVYDDWLKAAEFYQFLRSRTQWIVGDILRYGESRYGDKYAQAVDEHGKSTSRLQTYVYVCGRFEIERRRPELSFDHHAECASIDPREADRVLLEAIKLRWTKQDVREEVARINERNGVPKRGRKPGSTAAKVAASGKSPQVPEDEKPLIWEGKPLRVENVNGYRQIYAGNISLANDEADKAADHFKHAHGPALAAWLEEHGFQRKEGDEPCTTPDPKAQNELTAPASNTTETSATVASNGASVVQPDAAPQSALEVALARLKEAKSILAESPEWEPAKERVRDAEAALDRENLRAIEALKSAVSPVQSGPVEKFQDTPLLAAKRAAFDSPTQANLDALIREAQIAQPAVPAAPPTPSETPAATVTPPASEQTPLERAEAAILAFNTASAEVNEEEWKTIGENKLLRTKWLNRLLAQADLVIDKIQGHTPAPRK